MRRADLEHVIRVCADLVDDDEIVVIGSQAILGSHPSAPPQLLLSIDADVFPRNHPERADVIDGAIGEGSPFQEAFGYYAHAVGPETAKAPEGWAQRLVVIANENTRGATGLCLEPHDLVLSKCVAGREKDWAFATAALSAGIVDRDLLIKRCESLPVDEDGRTQIARMLAGA